MSALSLEPTNRLFKTLLIGDSGSGKTGSLISLIQAGLRLRVLDMDNKLQTGILPALIKQQCPEKAALVDFESLRDKLKASPMGYILDGPPKAFAGALQLMDKWSDGTRPEAWGADHVFVLDSLTFLSDAAFEWTKAMNPSVKDPRQWYGAAQQAVEAVLAKLTSSSFNTNVIVIAHVSWVDRPDGTMRGYPASVGKALGPTIPAYFDNMIMAQTKVGGKRELQIAPTAMVDLKNPTLGKLAQALPIETGLKTFFDAVKG